MECVISKRSYSVRYGNGYKARATPKQTIFKRSYIGVNFGGFKISAIIKYIGFECFYGIGNYNRLKARASVE